MRFPINVTAQKRCPVCKVTTIRTLALKSKQSLLTKFAFSARETAELLSISQRSLKRLADRKLLCPSRALRTPIYSREAIISFLSATA